jgi:hypothetical protein
MSTIRVHDYAYNRANDALSRTIHPDIQYQRNGCIVEGSPIMDTYESLDTSQSMSRIWERHTVGSSLHLLVLQSNFDQKAWRLMILDDENRSNNNITNLIAYDQSRASEENEDKSKFHTIRSSESRVVRLRTSVGSSRQKP